ncbi:hypothetical protein MHBO_002047 [Bonamia ostreae]|uniref:Protein kinase domain-containing protein n=1 Tax=Bonamia ostreae TaxID=126728 RepID=A0ABV2AL08_9EUKA
MESWIEHLHITSEELKNATCSWHENCEKSINDYEAVDVICKTATSTILKVKNKDEIYAVKCIDTTNDMRKFRAEVEVNNLSVLAGHENIVKCLHVFDTENHSLIFKELLMGDASDYKGEKDLNFYSVLGATVAEVLRFMHTKQIVYVDLKAENLMFDFTGKLKLCDFDLSYRTNIEYRIKLIKRGSRVSAAPEQSFGKCTNQTDWYCFGMTLWELLRGKTPNADFYGDDFWSDINENKADFFIFFDGFWGKVARLINKCLKNEPEKRLHLDDDKVFRQIKLFQNITEENIKKFQDDIVCGLLRKFLFLY